MRGDGGALFLSGAVRTPTPDPSPQGGGEKTHILIGSSEPMPFGVFIETQEPFGTAFQALP